MLTNPPVPYDFYVGNRISRLLTVGSTPVEHSVLNVKAEVVAFNQEKALLVEGAFSVIIHHRRLIVYSTNLITPGLVSCQGRVLGAALLTSPASHKPVFVSVGSGVSLDTAIRLVMRLSRSRVTCNIILITCEV